MQVLTVAQIQVVAGKSILEQHVRTPSIGVCELVWNAFDEDAHNVEITAQRGGVDALELIEIRDDGNGMSRERAELAFSKLGDSWKNVPGATTDEGRHVHGKLGRGRYSAFSLGAEVQWISTSAATDGGDLATISISGARNRLDSFEIDEMEPEEAKGTLVRIAAITDEAQKAFEEPEGLHQRLLTEFALHLDRHTNFSIAFLGQTIEPAAAVEAKTSIEVDLPPEVPGPARLTVIDWKLKNVERRLYLCKANGAIVGEMSPGVQAVGAEFTAYLEWDGFSDEPDFLLEGDESTAPAQVIAAAKETLRAHLSEAVRRREAATVKRWRDEGVYPYKEDPRTAVEKATRDTFNVIALAASRTVDEAKSQTSKALALDLLRETFENSPEALLPILRKFSQLPVARIEELTHILERTSLAHLIAMGKQVGHRFDFLNGLNALLFDKLTRKTLLERTQLHRILAHETWLFGEEWSLVGDDQRLTEVLKKWLEKLGLDTNLALGTSGRAGARRVMVRG